MGIIVDGFAARQEYNDLLLTHLLQEGEEDKESLVGFDKDVALLKTCHSTVLLGFLTALLIRQHHGSQ